MAKETKDALSVIGEINKKFGDGSIFKLSDNLGQDIEAFSTGSIGLDNALGIGGVARGRITEVYGNESAGKSALCLNIIADAQKKGYKCAFVDAEHCLSEGSLVYDADEDVYRTVEYLVEKKPEFSVISYSPQGYNFKQKASIKASGNRDVYEIKCSRGRSLKLTDNHKVLTSNGYTMVKDLKVNDVVYSPSNLPVNKSNDLTERESSFYRFLGYFISNGSKERLDISTIDKDVIADLENIAEIFNSRTQFYSPNLRFFKKTRNVVPITEQALKPLVLDQISISEMSDKLNYSKEVVVKALQHYGLYDKDSVRKNGYVRREQVKLGVGTILSLDKKPKPVTMKSGLYYEMQPIECFHQYSKHRKLPSNLNIEQLKQVLLGMFMSDGTVIDINYQHRATVSYSTSSRELAYDVSAALLKFGVFSNIGQSNKKKSDAEYYDTSYNVIINGVTNCKKFYENIPLFGYKGDRLVRAINSVGELNRIKIENNALFVHKVNSIEHVGKANTYDISVHNLDFEEQNFLAEGMIIHNSLDIEVAGLLGVNIEDLFVSQPSSGNQSLEIAKLLINSGEFAVVVLDSVTALVPEQETTDNFSFGDASVGLHARLMSQACRVLSPLAADKNVALIFTNQIREKIGGMSYDNTTTTGGRALRFYSSQRIELKKIQQIKTEEEVTGHIIKAKVVKNKVARPYRECTYEITYGQNSVRLNEIIELGVKYGFINKGGSWYSYGDTKIGQGAAKVKNFLIENKDIADTIEAAIKEKLANE